MYKNISGNIFDIQRFSVHDGPGIRTAVFFKGCNLRCLWCHNPEGIPMRPVELSFVPHLCIGCGYCFKACENGCHSMSNGRHVLERKNCTICGACAKECHANALLAIGRQVTAGEVMDEVLRDKMFYQTSGGGVTLSGGEPMLQREFARALLALAKAHGIHTAMQTCAVYDPAWLDDVKEYVDLFLVDYKATCPVQHKRLTGADNGLVYENLAKLHTEGKEVLLRCPIVPGLNDTREHFMKIAELTREYPGFVGAELLFYHRLGVPKIERFGLEGEVTYGEFDGVTKEMEREWVDVVRGFGGRLVNG